jgi:NDP-sugar pyrophosphorylase family protein
VTNTWQIKTSEKLKENGLTDIVLILGYLGDAIREYCGNGRRFGVSITYIVEDTPLGRRMRRNKQTAIPSKKLSFFMRPHIVFTESVF